MKSVFSGIMRRPLAAVSITVLVIFVAATVTAPLWAPDPSLISVTNRLQPPALSEPFGTDDFGRSILSRVVYGTRVSVIIGGSVAITSIVLGTITGLLTGYYRPVDATLSRIIDGMLAFPAFLLALALVAVLGPQIWTEVLALAAAFWPRVSRVVRSSVLQIREFEYVEAARSTGTRGFSILFRHILPNALSPIIIQGTFVFAEAILLDSALSFLGLGVAPPTPTWGNMLAESQVYLSTAFWFTFFPGIFIVLTVLSLNMLGDALRDELDPHTIVKT